MQGQLTDRYVAAKRIALAAMDADASAREALIEAHVGDDDELAREVRWMLEAIERTHTATLPLAAMPSPDLSGHQTQATAPRNYRILRLLGEGGMGMVYLAERCDEGFTQQVALKFLHATAEGSPILHERFSQERRLLARLEHPGIARLLDGGVMDGGRPFLAMEYIEGRRIDEWCDARAMPLNERIALFLKVCEAVEFAHRNLIIHRDIKPANILVTADGTPKLLDFGIARLIEEGGQVLATVTAAHALTLAYASPEQIEQQPLTTAADVYSLGVVLYQLVAGRRPYQHLVTPHLLSNAIVGGQVLAPSRSLREAPEGEHRPWGRSIPADIDAIVLKALRRQVSERYASVAELAEDLRHYLARRPVHARRGRQWYRLRRFAQRNRWPLAAAGMVLLAVLAGLTASLFALAQTRVAQRLAEQRQHEFARMVDFQQAMLQSVDIDAMGHALTRGERALVFERLGGTAGSPIDRPQLAQAFAGVATSGPARDALDTYVVSHALDRLDHDFADAPLLAADMRQSLARVLLTIGSYTHAAEELRKVVQARRQRLGAGDAPLLSARIDLGEALYRGGQLEQAALVYDSALPAAAALPPAAPLQVAALSGRARVLAAQGRLKQALERQEALYAGLAPRLPATDEGLLRLRRDRVETLTQLGQRDRARAELEQLVPLYRQTFGVEHPETLATTLTLATLLYSQDNEYERSLALAQDVAAIRERRLGADHPATLQARALAASNEVRLALDPATMAQVHARLDAVIQSYRRVLGADNPHTLEAMTDMVRLLSKQDRYPEAIALERAIVAGRNRTLGPAHFSTLYARGSLASLLCENGQYDQASAQGEQVLDALRRQLGEDHPMTLATYDLVGRIEAGAGHWAQARDAHAKALEGRARTLGNLDAHTIESASRLYVILLKLHDTAGARRVLGTYLQPVIAMKPQALNAGMRSVREEALAAVGN